ncbi:hypothetical protein [Pelagibacterium sp. H642]|uniref:hypothetical protein n=1 Tax=Pelagibacterium sp. H642 TaxID=1881069 RepID=UPI0028166742|nr:hypothetical protein [Pelagibacterium sp. H642]WMT90189.1 hypothetical protein NO934_15545 [Pelagibacterium sp. H642]
MWREDLESTVQADQNDHLRIVVKISMAVSAGATSISLGVHLLGWDGAWSGLGMSCAVTAAIGAFALAYLAAEPTGKAAEIAAAKLQSGRTSS